MELPPYRPPSANPNNTPPIGPTSTPSNTAQPTLSGPLQTPVQSTAQTLQNVVANDHFLKNNVAQQFNASVVKSQAIATSANNQPTSYQVTISINSPSGIHLVDTITTIPLVEGQPLKVEIVSPEQIRIIHFEKTGLSQVLNQYLTSALTSQEPLGHALKSLQQLQQHLQQQLQKQPTTQAASAENTLSAEKKHLHSLQQAVQKVLAQIPTVKHLSSAGTLKQSIQNSGVVLEAKIKALLNSTPNPQPAKTAPPATLKSTLAQLKQNIQQHLKQSPQQSSAVPPQESAQKTTPAASNLLSADLKVQLQRLQQTLHTLQQRQATPTPTITQNHQTAPHSSSPETSQSTPPPKTQQALPAAEKNLPTNPSTTATNRQASAVNTVIPPAAARFKIAPNPPSSHQPASPALPKPRLETALPALPSNPAPKKSALFSSATNKPLLPPTFPADTSHFFLNNSPLNRNPLTLQSAVTSTLDDFIETLLKQSSSGLARIQFNQLQSLFNLTQATLNDPATTQTLQTELPLTWKDSHIEIVQLTIEDKATQNEQEKEQQRQWQINLRFDFEEMGIIHIQLALNHTDANTIIWVEQSNSIPAFEKHLEQLNQSLQKLGLSVNEIQCRQGLPIINQTRLDTHLVDINT